VSANDPRRSDLAASSEFEPGRYASSAVVYAERDDEILLLQRAEGSAMAGQWFLPGGFVEAGELPEEGARRELFEEGDEADGPPVERWCRRFWTGESRPCPPRLRCRSR
jgi:hypothetical protein